MSLRKLSPEQLELQLPYLKPDERAKMEAHIAEMRAQRHAEIMKKREEMFGFMQGGYGKRLTRTSEEHIMERVHYWLHVIPPHTWAIIVAVGMVALIVILGITRGGS